MFCSKCGTKLDDDAKFCQDCGTATNQSSSNTKEEATNHSAITIESTEPISSNVSSPPKKKNWLFVLIPAVVIGALIVIFGNNDESLGKYNDYVMDIMTIVEKENYINDKYDSLIDGSVDDYDFYMALNDEIIPKSKDFITNLEEIRPKNKELREIHDIWLEAWNLQYGAFTLMMSALENGDYAKITEANDRLDKARKLCRDYVDALEDYREKNGIELVDIY